MKRYNIRGVKVFPFESVDQLIDYADGHKGILVAINADKVIWATDETRKIIDDNIGYCDGAGAVMALKKAGAKGIIRIPGCELWLHIIQRFQHSKSFYLVGSKPDVLDATVAKLRSEFPGINIVGYRDGYLKDDAERQALIANIADKRPDVVFVAMGSPKQELLMRDMAQAHHAIYQGLGGSFDVYSGHQSRAPQWMCSMNMEFLYRLIIRPKRIKRDIHKLKFAYWILTNKLTEQ